MKQKILIRIDCWITAWVDMICGFVSIITFTLYRPWWDIEIRCWFDKHRIYRKFKHNQNKKDNKNE